MNSRLASLQRLLALLGDPSRFRIVVTLASRERHVSELAGLVRLSQSCTTRHVQALERSGLVRTHRAGRRVMIGLDAGAPDAAALFALVREHLHAAGSPAAAAPEAAPHAMPARARRGRPGATPPAVPRGAPPEEDRSHIPAAASATSRTPVDDGAASLPVVSRQDLDDFLL